MSPALDRRFRRLLRDALRAALTLAPLHAHAADRVWLVGGGYDLDNALVQIEQNVLWAREILSSLPGERAIQTLFNDGEDPAPDVTLWQRPAEDASNLQPLARVYGQFRSNGEAVRSHRVTPVDGPATRGAVIELLRRGMERLGAGDRGLLVYAGHGSPAETGSRLDLWGGGSLGVSDLQEAIARQPPGSTLRLVFTQCYSGGFHPLVLDRPADTQRCAFYAAPHDRPAEGCTTSLDVSEYRGYGTYFFAALAGRARDGGPLHTDPDRDGDGRTDPYEAHLYTLRAARSTDLPRSSSEQYLLDWEPWYLPLLRVRITGANPYAALARALAGDLGLADAGRSTLTTHRKQVGQQIRRLMYRQEQARNRAEAIMDRLQTQVEGHWPRVRYPHTHAYLEFLQEDLAAAQHFIENHPAYPLLVQDQDAYWTLDTAILELQRRSAQLDRIDLLQRLARLRDAFLDRADTAEQAVYTGLLSCEQQPL